MLAKLARVCPFLLLGPLTGPLAAGFVSSLRAGRPTMAGIYALGVVEVWAGLPIILADQLTFIAHHAFLARH